MSETSRRIRDHVEVRPQPGYAMGYDQAVHDMRTDHDRLPWAADGSRDSVWVIGDHVVQRRDDGTYLNEQAGADPIALAAALRASTDYIGGSPS